MTRCNKLFFVQHAHRTLVGQRDYLVLSKMINIIHVQQSILLQHSRIFDQSIMLQPFIHFTGFLNLFRWIVSRFQFATRSQELILMQRSHRHFVCNLEYTLIAQRPQIIQTLQSVLTKCTVVFLQFVVFQKHGHFVFFRVHFRFGSHIIAGTACSRSIANMSILLITSRHIPNQVVLRQIVGDLLTDKPLPFPPRYVFFQHAFIQARCIELIANIGINPPYFLLLQFFVHRLHCHHEQILLQFHHSQLLGLQLLFSLLLFLRILHQTLQVHLCQFVGFFVCLIDQFPQSFDPYFRVALGISFQVQHLLLRMSDDAKTLFRIQSVFTRQKRRCVVTPCYIPDILHFNRSATSAP
mmetsp:Transcript_65573/g.104444  ORF Transcript_65573/g.104444 Transcript_65573/m.104444 type:complete len:353 (-) Transcript_65573:502-1560(-)